MDCDAHASELELPDIELPDILYTPSEVLTAQQLTAVPKAALERPGLVLHQTGHSGTPSGKGQGPTCGCRLRAKPKSAILSSAPALCVDSSRFCGFKSLCGHTENPAHHPWTRHTPHSPTQHALAPDTSPAWPETRRLVHQYQTPLPSHPAWATAMDPA